MLWQDLLLWSALIHAATMVTAGVYMVARSNILYSIAPFSLEVIGYVGAFTGIGCRLDCGLHKTILKKYWLIQR